MFCLFLFNIDYILHGVLLPGLKDKQTNKFGTSANCLFLLLDYFHFIKILLANYKEHLLVFISIGKNIFLKNFHPTLVLNAMSFLTSLQKLPASQ